MKIFCCTLGRYVNKKSFAIPKIELFWLLNDHFSDFQRLLSANEVLTHETVIKELFDEHAASLFIRVNIKILCVSRWSIGTNRDKIIVGSLVQILLPPLKQPKYEWLSKDMLNSELNQYMALSCSG